jgi:hypothetical protein
MILTEEFCNTDKNYLQFLTPVGTVTAGSCNDRVIWSSSFCRAALTVLSNIELMLMSITKLISHDEDRLGHESIVPSHSDLSK